jgi:hypothetical protein
MRRLIAFALTACSGGDAKQPDERAPVQWPVVVDAAPVPRDPAPQRPGS